MAMIYTTANADNTGYRKGKHQISLKNLGTKEDPKNNYSHSSFGITNRPKLNISHHADLTTLRKNAWFDDNYRRFHTTVGSIMYNMRVYIDYPNDADDELKQSVRDLNNARPLVPWERVNAQRFAQIELEQKKCLFYVFRYYCLKSIQRAKDEEIIQLPFLKTEPIYQLYFAKIMEVFLNTTQFDDESLFDNFMDGIKQIPFRVIKEINGIEFDVNQILTMVLDCDNGTLMYYVDKKLVKKVEIDKEESYHFVIWLHDDSKLKFKIVDDSLVTELR